jgi:hypothetical protein
MPRRARGSAPTGSGRPGRSSRMHRRTPWSRLPLSRATCRSSASAACDRSRARRESIRRAWDARSAERPFPTSTLWPCSRARSTPSCGLGIRTGARLLLRDGQRDVARRAVRVRHGDDRHARGESLATGIKSGAVLLLVGLGQLDELGIVRGDRGAREVVVRHEDVDEVADLRGRGSLVDVDDDRREHARRRLGGGRGGRRCIR